MSTVALPSDVRFLVPPGVHNLHKFRAWAHSKNFPETGKVTFVGGQIEVDMSPEGIGAHLKVKREITARILGFVEKHGLGDLLPDGALLVNEQADLAAEPDMVFCLWESLQSGKVEYRRWGQRSDDDVEVVGSPDLVVEVISPSSVAKDRQRLRKAYFDAGIQESWLIDARGERLSFEILVRSRRGFVAVPVGRDGYARSPLFGRKFRLVRRWDRVGRATYRLLIR